MDNLYNITKFPAEELRCKWLIYRDDQLIGVVSDNATAKYFVQRITEIVQQEHNTKNVKVINELHHEITIPSWWSSTIITARAEPVYEMTKPVAKKRAASFGIIERDERDRRPVTRVPTPCPSPTPVRIPLYLQKSSTN